MKTVIKICFLVTGIWLLVTSLAFAQAAPDPIRIATGARPLGMGKAFVGLADDVGSVFLNPAGLANPNRWQVTSMSGKLLDEFSYLSLSGVYPTNYGNLGFAFVGSSIGGALPTTVEAGSSPDDPIYTIDTTTDPMNYSNNLFLLSYGSKLSRFLQLPGLAEIGKRYPGLNDINVGANLKLFTVYLTGDRISQGNANGTEMDLGVQGKALPWLSLGGNLQNALPASMGGKLHYESGWDESYPAVMKLGLCADVLGPEKAIRQFGTHRLKLLADVDYEISRADKVPAIFHLGAEWKPLDAIALRAGIDQEMAGANQTASNFTTGVGVYYGDFRFDTAYHQFAGAPGIDNYFFSLSYGIVPMVIKDPLIASPDKLITDQLVAKVSGTAVDPEIVAVKVGGVKVALTPRGEFQTSASLTVGKNAIMVEGFNSSGKLIASKKLRILRLITYPDVARDYWAAEQVSYIGTLGIIQGYPDGTFRPEGNITRAELSTLLIRTVASGDANVPAAAGVIFKDVPLRHWAAKYVNLASLKGIVKGYPDNTFKPNANITRAEGLAMIARFGGVTELAYAGTEFADVNARHWAAPIIAGAFREGMLIHFKDQPFEPSKKLNRAEAVEMLYRSTPVFNLISDLKDFEKY
ncbi:MAG: S-layer homology domain-containing protein [Acidobacteriia bacterium]|nr:S-layer homology domain-containing protein [Terriglobia bacterium]